MIREYYFSIGIRYTYIGTLLEIIDRFNFVYILLLL